MGGETYKYLETLKEELHQNYSVEKEQLFKYCVKNYFSGIGRHYWDMKVGEVKKDSFTNMFLQDILQNGVGYNYLFYSQQPLDNFINCLAMEFCKKGNFIKNSVEVENTLWFVEFLDFLNQYRNNKEREKFFNVDSLIVSNLRNLVSGKDYYETQFELVIRDRIKNFRNTILTVSSIQNEVDVSNVFSSYILNNYIKENFRFVEIKEFRII